MTRRCCVIRPGRGGGPFYEVGRVKGLVVEGEGDAYVISAGRQDAVPSSQPDADIFRDFGMWGDFKDRPCCFVEGVGAAGVAAFPEQEGFVLIVDVDNQVETDVCKIGLEEEFGGAVVDEGDLHAVIAGVFEVF